MTDREKMIKVIKKAFEDCGRMLKEQIPRVLSGEIKKASDGTPPLDEAIADALIEAGIRDTNERGWIFMNGEAIVPTPEIYNKVADLLDCPKILEDKDDD